MRASHVAPQRECSPECPAPAAHDESSAGRAAGSRADTGACKSRYKCVLNSYGNRYGGQGGGREY